MYYEIHMPCSYYSFLPAPVGRTKQTHYALYRYDQNSLYNKNPMVTAIMSEGSPFQALLEDNDGSIWFGYAGGLYRYVGKTIREFSNNEGLK
jgi:ligand-binding sensor domain-containing protein